MCDDILVVNFKDFGSQAALASAFGDRWIYIGRENRGAWFDASLLANPFRVAEYGGRGRRCHFIDDGCGMLFGVKMKRF